MLWGKFKERVKQSNFFLLLIFECFIQGTITEQYEQPLPNTYTINSFLIISSITFSDISLCIYQVCAFLSDEVL